jgi:hypothetical protein
MGLKLGCPVVDYAGSPDAELGLKGGGGARLEYLRIYFWIYMNMY